MPSFNTIMQQIAGRWDPALLGCGRIGVGTGGPEGPGPPDFLFEGAQYVRGPSLLKNAAPSLS